MMRVNFPQENYMKLTMFSQNIHPTEAAAMVHLFSLSLFCEKKKSREETSVSWEISCRCL